VKNDAPIDEKNQEQETPNSFLEELIREGARRLLQAAIEQEVTEYLERFREENDDKGHRMVVRNGRLPERMLVTGVGPLRMLTEKFVRPTIKIGEDIGGGSISAAYVHP